MIRKTGWEWRGNYFDPDLPLSLELHFRLWDRQTEKIGIDGLEEFWERREKRTIDGLSFSGLSRMDAIGYASLHLLRHLLRGDVRPAHVYELASFFEKAAPDAAFWESWSTTHSESLRRVVATCAALAQAWFACRLSAPVQAEIARLPAPVQRWLAEYALSPLASLFQPNKDELWLHLSLLDSLGAKASVLQRRLLPFSLPGAIGATHVPAADLTLAIRLRAVVRYGVFLFLRLVHHALALPGVLTGAIRWFAPSLDLGREYWRFFLAAGLFDFGLFVYFLLYNLYLLQLGFLHNGRVRETAPAIFTANTIQGGTPAPTPAYENFCSKKEK